MDSTQEWVDRVECTMHQLNCVYKQPRKAYISNIRDHDTSGEKIIVRERGV